MLQDGRGRDQEFKDKERLYFRCVGEDIENNRILAARIPYNEISNNRSKYSEPWDVIFDYPQHGIFQLQVLALPIGLPQEQPHGRPIALHDFRPEHVPLPENYAHSEIWTYRASARVPRLSSELVKKEFRAIISDRSVVLWRPGI